MLDHALESAFIVFLKADAGFVGVRFFTGHDDEDRRAPSITIESRSEALAGSAVVFRSELTVVIESAGHDCTADTHAALVEKVRERVANRVVAAELINAAGQIHLYGYAFSGSSIEVDGTRFRTTLTLKIGYGIA